MKTFVRLVCATTAAVALATPVVLAHHSAAAYDTQKQVTINGVIKSYRYANPHVLLLVEVKQEDGSTVTMDVEAGAASVLNGLGFTKDSLKVGDLVTISGNPNRTNTTAMLGRDLYKKPDGTYVPLNISSKSIYEAKVNGTATTIADAQLHRCHGSGEPCAADREGQGRARCRGSASLIAEGLHPGR